MKMSHPEFLRCFATGQQFKELYDKVVAESESAKPKENKT